LYILPTNTAAESDADEKIKNAALQTEHDRLLALQQKTNQKLRDLEISRDEARSLLRASLLSRGDVLSPELLQVQKEETLRQIREQIRGVIKAPEETQPNVLETTSGDITQQVLSSQAALEGVRRVSAQQFPSDFSEHHQHHHSRLRGGDRRGAVGNDGSSNGNGGVRCESAPDLGLSLKLMGFESAATLVEANSSSFSSSSRKDGSGAEESSTSAAKLDAEKKGIDARFPAATTTSSSISNSNKTGTGSNRSSTRKVSRGWVRGGGRFMASSSSSPLHPSGDTDAEAQADASSSFLVAPSASVCWASSAAVAVV